MSRKLRVLHIGNGKAFKIRAIVDGLRARGHEMHMVPIPPSAEGFDGATWHQLPDSRLPGGTQVIERMLRLRGLVRRLKPDVVHAHNACGPGWYGAAAGRHPLVIHAYGGDLLPDQIVGRPAIQRILTAWACRAADRIVVTGQHMVGASSHLGVDPGRVTVLPRGVDLKRYRPGLDVTPLRQRLGLGNAGPIVLSPRYQVDEALYNLDLVMAAFVEIRRRFPRAICIQMYGSDRRAGVSKLEGLASRYGLGESYRLVPSVDNTEMPYFYNLADVTVSAPASDGFPVTVLEASACGCPLVVSDLPYCREWFTSKDHGLVVAVGDAAALARAVIDLCADPELRRRMGATARTLVESRADYETCMDRLETVYFDLIDGSTRKSTEAN